MGKVRKTEIRKAIRQESVIKKLVNKQTNWWTYILNEIRKKVAAIGESRKKKRSRPRKTWIERMDESWKRRGKKNTS